MGENWNRKNYVLWSLNRLNTWPREGPEGPLFKILLVLLNHFSFQLLCWLAFQLFLLSRVPNSVFRVFRCLWLQSQARGENKSRRRDTNGWSWASVSHHNWDRFAWIPLQLPSSHTHFLWQDNCSRNLSPKDMVTKQETGQNSRESLCESKLGFGH